MGSALTLATNSYLSNLVTKIGNHISDQNSVFRGIVMGMLSFHFTCHDRLMRKLFPASLGIASSPKKSSQKHRIPADYLVLSFSFGSIMFFSRSRSIKVLRDNLKRNLPDSLWGSLNLLTVNPIDFNLNLDPHQKTFLKFRVVGPMDPFSVISSILRL